jgi:NAD(P)-dependent dehydrogenase (short-subunit alcohol dehydrogenase family)
MSSTQKPVAIVTGASSGIGLGITLALEYAANNIRFNTVSPGTINTSMHAKDKHAALAKFHPLARMGEISDIVDAALCLQKATFVTGENIRVDGGVHAGRD